MSFKFVDPAIPVFLCFPLDGPAVRMRFGVDDSVFGFVAIAYFTNVKRKCATFRIEVNPESLLNHHAFRVANHCSSSLFQKRQGERVLSLPRPARGLPMSQ